MDLQSTETVVRPLNEGVVSVSKICKSLLEAQVDPTTDLCSNYDQIREHIEQAEQCLKKSETTVKTKVKCLDVRMEQLTKQKGAAEQKRKEKCKAKDELDIKKKSAKESLENSKKALTRAKENVESTKNEIKKEQSRKKTGERVAGAGVGICAIPIVGWIAGPIMIHSGINAMEDASKAIRDAEYELEKNESKVKENNRKVSNYQSKILKIQNEIEETDKVLSQNQKDIEKVKQHLEVTADIQGMVRKAVNLLSVLSGRVSVLERQTRRSIPWNPVVKAIEDVMEAVEKVAENRLFNRQGASGLMNTLRGNVGALLALCNTSSSSEYDAYC